MRTHEPIRRLTGVEMRSELNEYTLEEWRRIYRAKTGDEQIRVAKEIHDNRARRNDPSPKVIESGFLP